MSISIRCTCVQIRTVWCGKHFRSSIKPLGVNHSVIDWSVITRLLLGLSVNPDCRSVYGDKNTHVSVLKCPESPGDGILAGCENICRRHAVCNSWWKTIRLSGRLQDVHRDRSTPAIKNPSREVLQQFQHAVDSEILGENQPNESKRLQLHDPGLQLKISMRYQFSTFFTRVQGITALHQTGFPHER